MSIGAHIVVGPGREATQVAATLAALGATVTLVRTAPCLPEGLSCEASPTWKQAPAGSSVAAQVIGPTRPAEPTRVGIFAGGGARTLPLEPWSLASVLPGGQRRQAARSWVRARARNSLAVVVGGGQEERTYRDWVVRRMGEPTYAALYADYAERRWGRPGEQLSSSVARMAHSPELRTTRVRPEDVRDHGPQRAESLLSACGVRVLECAVQSLEVEGGSIARIVTADDTLPVGEARLWTTLAPAALAELLGAGCPASVAHLAPLLEGHPTVRTRLSHARPGLPDDLHVLDPAPCWRFVRAPDDPTAWILSSTGPHVPSELEDVRDFAVQAGLVGPSAAVIASASVPGGVPAWGPVDHARLRTVLSAWQGLGISATGSGGTLTPLDPTELVAHVEALAAGSSADLQEAWRSIAAPPTRVDDLGAQVTHFFAGV